MLDQSGDRTQPSSSETQTEHKQVGEELLSACDVPKNPDENLPISGEEKFSSPIQVTPLFRSLADGIPSPQFSESVSLSFMFIIQYLKSFNQTLSLKRLTAFAGEELPTKNTRDRVFISMSKC